MMPQSTLQSLRQWRTATPETVQQELHAYQPIIPLASAELVEDNPICHGTRQILEGYPEFNEVNQLQSVKDSATQMPTQNVGCQLNSEASVFYPKRK